MTTLLQNLGGQPAVDAVVDKFYDIMLADPVVNHYFKNTDMTRQRSQQKSFLGMVFFKLLRHSVETTSILERI